MQKSCVRNKVNPIILRHAELLLAAITSKCLKAVIFWMTLSVPVVEEF